MTNGNQITLYGDGSSRRDYTYVDDIIDGVMAAVNYDQSMYEIINLGNNRTVELLELVEAIEDASGIEPNRTFGPEQAGDVHQTRADVSKAETLLGYSPNYSLEKGLANFVDWYNSMKCKRALKNPSDG